MFEQVIGQHDIQERLLQLKSEERLPHALMLCHRLCKGIASGPWRCYA